MAVKTAGKVPVKKGTAKKKTVKKSASKVPTISKSYAVNKSGQIIAKKKSYVISKGIRKARRKSIRKFADVYRLGIANMGLAELSPYGSVDTYDRDGWRVEHTTYTDNVSKPVNGGKIVACVSLDIYQSTVRSASDFEYGIGNDWNRYYEARDENPNTQYWSDNAVGTMKVEVRGRIEYKYESDSRDITKLCDVEGEGYAVEDVLDALTRDSESAWDEVKSALGPIIGANSVMPKIIQIPSTLGEVDISRGLYQTWRGSKTFADTLQVNDFIVEISVSITGCSEDSYYYNVGLQEVADYFEVEAQGKFEDYNERPSMNIHDPSPSSWVRSYKGQGADTLEGAIAIATSNVAEICQEFTDYLNAEHNYVTQSNGKGYARTTTDQNDWYYNFGDSTEDYLYERTVMNDGVIDPFTGQPTSPNGLSDEGVLGVLLKEYLGEKYYLVQGDWANSRWDVSPKSWCKSEAQDFLLTTELTRDGLERACRMVGGFEVEDYIDPLNFTVRRNVRIELSTKKSKRGKRVNKVSKSQFARRYLNKVAQLKKSKGIKKDYNGWPNYETWGFMLIWDNCGYGQSLYEDIEYRVDDVRNTDEVKDAIRGEIEYILEEVDEYIQNGSDFVKQLANCVTNEVDVDRCVEAILDELDIDNRFGKSAKKSKSGIRKYGLSPWSIFGDIDDLVGDITRMYNVWENDDKYKGSTQESELFNKIDEQMEDLYSTLNAYADELGRLTKSAKKSKYSNIHRSLNKIGGFTKEDDEEEVPRTIGSKKRRVKMHKESNLPEDADDQQEQNIKGSGNAGSLMPEDAEDVARSSKRRKGMRKSYREGDLLTTVHFNDDLLTVAQYLYDAGYRATEEDRATLMGGADEDEQYSKSEVDQIFEYFKQIEDGKSVKRRKGVRKFSVTPGGSPDQTSYIDRYNQAPRVRSAIDSHFSDTQMLQERIDAMGKSRRNSLKNNVPTTLVTTKKRR